MSPYQEYIYYSRYSRWLPSEGRRETWEETIMRYMSMWEGRLSTQDTASLTSSLLAMEIMPSMRLMWSAGESVKRNNIHAYNCAFIGVDHLRAFDETLYLLCCGCGVGFSVEGKYTNKLPIINDVFTKTERTIKIQDSKEGWAKAVRKCIADAHLGYLHEYDYSDIRPLGARLVTSGGRASGPEPLVELITFLENTIQKAKGRKLTPIECHDIICKIATVVVSGGVRRSALISLSNLNDLDMRDAKTGQWWKTHPHRALANNSAVYEQKPEVSLFLREWLSLIESKSGERGIFNLTGAKTSCNKRRMSEPLAGTNPCGEIVLRSAQFCNLTEVVARKEDSLTKIAQKIKNATLLGTLQSSLTEFQYIRNIWKRNTEEERLLGLSLTGIQDCPALAAATPSQLEWLRNIAIKWNKIYAAQLKITPSTAITTIKPSGTVSQLVDSSSGIHARYSNYYIRNVRQDNSDPITKFLQDLGVPNAPDIHNTHATVFSFPVKAPDLAKTTNTYSAPQQLRQWLKYKKHWAEHSVSCTIHVKEHEWLTVGKWVHTHFDEITGLSFLPFSEHIYTQAPYQAITKKEYAQRVTDMPVIDWSNLTKYEQEDNTTGHKELACVAGQCDI